jgi:hypothetical protein
MSNRDPLTCGVLDGEQCGLADFQMIMSNRAIPDCATMGLAGELLRSHCSRNPGLIIRWL